eukprot:1485897-Alexandrium_andersonii.AAC.1
MHPLNHAPLCVHGMPEQSSPPMADGIVGIPGHTTTRWADPDAEDRRGRPISAILRRARWLCFCLLYTSPSPRD